MSMLTLRSVLESFSVDVPYSAAYITPLLKVKVENSSFTAVMSVIIVLCSGLA